WFIGYNPRIVVGVWVGFDDRRSLGDREAGASAALPIWISFMREAFNTIPDQTFPIPEKIVYAKVDPKTGLLSSGSSTDSVTEPFIKGSEPKTFSRRTSAPSDFSNIDQ
ncbi:MAG TPA: penicillin-binding protein 1A, partial [Nitrospiria bacterium]|nr:penicillin-binding protein 1A [Nitrospiria bacterium]